MASVLTAIRRVGERKKKGFIDEVSKWKGDYSWARIGIPLHLVVAGNESSSFAKEVLFWVCDSILTLNYLWSLADCSSDTSHLANLLIMSWVLIVKSGHPLKMPLSKVCGASGLFAMKRLFAKRNSRIISPLESISL
ncbi:hypothetical protein AVEN_63890-1 [Araneus ventricosus]|uniref:Uncharacterized protein n=1 Tax=Araneus ventricosus TaxID=182803 RepID=A0A4Y2M1N1_ARAVE|nr:hypothetical protein AVEN_63890-1 [Araneus ventricosus]